MIPDRTDAAHAEADRNRAMVGVLIGAADR